MPPYKFPIAVALLACLLAPPAWARDVGGTSVPDRVTVAGVPLTLNGTGVRERFFFDIYVAALYVREPSHDPAALLREAPPKRMLMHVLYRHVTKDELNKAWGESFAHNLSAAEQQTLAPRLTQFQTLFVDLKRGDEVALDLLDDGTHVSINGQARGGVAGRDFNDAVLRVWLGPRPPSEKLKDALLGKS